MPLFRPRTRPEILRVMIARVIARTPLVGLVRNSVIFHLLAAAADEDAEQYFQLANLRKIFSIDTATGSDLDSRAAEIQPGVVVRRTALFTSGDVTFGRTDTTASVLIPAGTIISAEDAQGQIKYRTTANATILAGNNSVAGVTVVAIDAGERANVEEFQIVQFITRVPGVETVANQTAFSNGRNRESDASFRARLKRHVQALSRGTPIAIESFALNAQLPDGRRPLFAKVVEPIVPTGTFDVILDDGTGTIEEFEETFLFADDPMLPAANGGEVDVFTTNRPIRDDGTFQLFINAALQVRDVDYVLNAPMGKCELLAPLTLGDTVTGRYRNYIGLIQEVQRIIDGDFATAITHPGVRAAGTLAQVLPATPVFQSLAANVAVASDFDVEEVLDNVREALLDYINGLDIGAPVIVAELCSRAMEVEGVFNFQVTDLSGTSPAVDQVIPKTQVARITSANLIIT
jgi:uncharacterized phage protein gp47/JayE